jgi:type I restriction enzyme S subunit
VKEGDILVSTVRPNLNAVARVCAALDGATASTGFCVARPKAGKLDDRYLFHWVRTPQFVSDMVRRATGASYPAVSDRIVLESELPLPPLSEQRRIADILDKADALRAQRRAALARLDTLAQSIFLDMFGDPRTNPRGLRKEPLQHLIKLKSGDFLPATEMVEGGIYPVFGGNGISGFHDNYMFEERQIVLGRVGVYCGCVHVSPPKSWITDNALYVSERSPELTFEYLARALDQARLNQYASQFGQPLISGSRIYPINILIPPQDLQVKFEARIARVRNLKRLHESSTSEVENLFTSLQHRAFRGELTPGEASKAA